MSNVEKQWVEFDERGFGERLKQEQRRLDTVRKAQGKVNREDLCYITAGRTSGLSLALSFMEEFVVRPKERK